MRSFRLARIAAQAELLRLRHLLRRQAVRAALGAIALVFLLACLGALHVVSYLALRLRLDALTSAAIVAGADLLLALIFGGLALRDSPGRVEQEALLLRQTAQAQMMEAAAATIILGPVLRLLGVRKLYGLALAALTALYLGRRR